MLNHYFPLVYFSCFVTVKEDETEKKKRTGKKSEMDIYFF